MIKLHSTQCCALGEINHLGKMETPIEALQALYPQLLTGTIPPAPLEYAGYHKVPLIIFTGVTERVIGDHSSGRMDDYGQAFADYLTVEQLGTVVKALVAKNWTRNMIGVWVWTPDYPALEVWAAKNIEKAA